MPNITTLKTNFTAGEFTPLLNGRVDIERYNNACKEMTNAYPLIYGGFINRHGSKFIAEAKYSDRNTVLIPFAYNIDQTYMLEFGDFYMRVYKDGAQVESAPGVPFEIATPYGEAVLDHLSIQQSADTMFIENETTYPQRLQRFGDADWFMGNAPISVEPFDEIGLVPDEVLTLSGLAVGSETATTANPTFLASDVGRFLISGQGTAEITAVNSTTSVDINITAEFSGTSLPAGDWKLDVSPQATCTPSSAAVIGTQINLTLNAAGWRSSDVGSYVEINGGLCLINGITTDQVATAIVKESLSSAAGSPALAWTLNSSIWNDALGYPQAGLLHDQRWFLAGSTRYPQSFAATQTGSLTNFQRGTNDDDGFLFNIAGSQDQIVHLIDIRQMLTIGNGGVFSVSGGVEKPITPTNVQIRAQTDQGGSNVRPIRIDNEIYYVSRSRKRMLTASYKIEIEGFDVVDVSKIAEHIASKGMKYTSYQKDPDSLLYAVLDDGDMASITIDRSENVTGWAKHETQGQFQSVATIPIEGTEQTWLVVDRDIDGEVKKYIEVITPGLKLDSAIMGESAQPATVWSGLDHLENKTVKAVADGYVFGDYVVNNGQIELPTPVNTVSIGLGYTAKVVLLPAEISSQTGSSQGKNVRNAEAIVKVVDTLGGKVNDVEIPYRRVGQPTDEPIPLYTGIIKTRLLGWDKENPGLVTITQDQPLPMHVQSVARRLTVNG